MTFNGHSHHVVAVAFSPDGKRIISGSFDRTVKLWDVASGKEVITLGEHSGVVWSVAFSANGRRIAAAGGHGTVKFWDTLDWTKSDRELEAGKLERWRKWLREQD